MKYRILIISLFLSFVCYSQNRKITNKELCNGVLYKLPSKVQKSLSEKLKEKSNVYMELSQESDSIYRIYINEYIDNVFIEKSNKFIIVDGVPYRILLSTDYTFGVKQSPKDILTQIEKNEVYMSTSLMKINDSNEYIEFDIRN
ncbi:hypothetical protein [Paenimyroides baculatum]|uniref:Uncharacterized protein n=1 Tax=Paenimyroides baculatum TaxID=2608000 RepID=A0A5M6C935_9FLAO|nr:hypothetical protein [Paenimyroides baculatum]KAA5531604.1 hypothetical protein F0460_15955 [Paenimyroides baculatum]